MELQFSLIMYVLDRLLLSHIYKFAYYPFKNDHKR